MTNAGLTELAAAINSDRVDVNIANGGFDGAVTNAGLTALNGTIGLNKVNINLTSDAVGLATQATLNNVLTKSTLSTTAEIKTFLSIATINAGAQSAEFDTEHYLKVRFFGESTASVGTDIVLMGSNVSGGTFYILGENLRSDTISGVHYVYGADIENLPRYIKLLNKSGSNNYIFTKLYFQGSGGRVAV